MAAFFAVAALACAGAAEAAQASAVGTAAVTPGRPTSSALPASVDFGSVQIGVSSDPVTVTLTNSGAGTLSFWRFGIASSSANPSDFSVVAGGTCSLSAPLGSGESCTLLVRFKPTAAGLRSGLLSFWDNTSAGRINIALNGSATPPPVLSVSDTSVDFGSVQLGMSVTVTLTLTNSGAGSLSLWRFGIASSSANPSDFGVIAGGTCSLSLPLGSDEICTLVVRFKPTTGGARSGLLSFWDNTVAGRSDTVLNGNALPASESSVSPALVDYGSVQIGSSSAPTTVTLTNSGAGSLSPWRFGIATSSANPRDFSVVAGGTCSPSLPLAHAESCTVLVRFKPTATGLRSGLLSFWDNTIAGRIDIALSGNALPAPESSASPAPVNFGSVQVGSSGGPTVVTLTSSGAGSLSLWRFGIASSSANPSDFSVVAGGTCSLSLLLGNGESCTVLVRFRPTTGGVRSGLLSFWDNTIVGRIDVALTGSGDDLCGAGCF